MFYSPCDYRVKYILAMVSSIVVVAVFKQSARSPSTHASSSPAWRDRGFCTVTCRVGTPCEYADQVDLRIIVMTYNRPQSLRNCLKSVSRLDTLGDHVAVEIWIDSLSADRMDIDARTLEVAEEFQASWRSGRVCVHRRERNAHIGGQWIDTWRPWPGTEEVALILEDDVDVSSQAYRWLKAVHAEYRDTENIAGYTLQMENTVFFAGDKGALRGPEDDNVFMYGVIGTWGFSPHPKAWRAFQDWYHSKDNSTKPYVPGILPTSWYQSAERHGSEASMWEMWHIYYTYVNKQYTVYCNLHVETGKSNVLLSSNRKETGLHNKGQAGRLRVNWEKLMKKWKNEYGKFPVAITKYSFNGTVLS